VGCPDGQLYYENRSSPTNYLWSSVVDKGFTSTIPVSIVTPFTYTTNRLEDAQGQLCLSDSSGGCDQVSAFMNISTVTLAEDTLAVPAPLAGGGIPGMLLAASVLLGWWRRKRNHARHPQFANPLGTACR
jgi:hypothetical protein